MKELKLLDGVTADASLSPCGTYRYVLTRDWFPKTGAGGDLRHVLFVMLNPSVGDANVDDPTLRRCQEFARVWGYDGITVVNLYTLRSPDPSVLRTHPDPVGPANDEILHAMLTAKGVGLVVAAWGTKASPQRVGAFTNAAFKAGRDVFALRQTKGGYPEHPLYLPGELEPFLWRSAS